MANQLKGQVPLVVGDEERGNRREYTLVLDMEGLVEAESIYGKPLAVTMHEAGLGFLGAQAALLQGALSRHHTISRKEALELLQNESDAVTDALTKAMEAAFPDEQGGEGNADAPRDGASSGGNGAKPA